MSKIKKQRSMAWAGLAGKASTSAVALTLLAAAQAPVQAQNQSPRANVQQNQLSDDDAAAKFFAFGYNYCDAQVLASFWSQKDAGEAKVTMGHKLWNLDEKTVNEIVREARAEALAKPLDRRPTWFTDAGYTYDDAEVLAGFWDSDDIYESKITMTELLIGGHDNVIKAALRSARRR